MVIDIPVTAKTHNPCLICPTVRKIFRRISRKVQIDLMIKNGIWISDESRLCSLHSREDNTLKPEHQDLITATNNTSVWTPNEVLSLIDYLRDEEQIELNFKSLSNSNESEVKVINGLFNKLLIYCFFFFD
jgi:hypothetical protein